MQLNTEQIEILNHTATRAAGGYYCGDSPDMQKLVALGLMESAGFKSYVPDEYFRLTKEGHQAGVYWNWAMRPGWQKWKPNYRYGTITEIDHDADTCSVTLDECLSTDTPDGAAMDINQTSALSGVPIEYMSCNSAAFSVGDEVVVKFEGFEWGGAKVIGFKQAPQACWWEPWGEELCSNHQWSMTHNHRTTEEDDTIYESGLCQAPSQCYAYAPKSFEMYDDGNYFWQNYFYVAETVESISHLIIKTTFSGCDGDDFSGWEYTILLTINGTNHYFRLKITYTTPAPLLPTRHDCQPYYDSETGIFTIPLSAWFSVPVDITQVGILMTSFGYCECNAIMEYLDLVNLLEA